MILVDTHCHLDLVAFDLDRDAVLARAREAGLHRILVPGTDLASSRRAVALAERFLEVRAAVGVHPNSVGSFGARELEQLRELARHPKVDAIGEIGIDLYWKTVPLAEQRRAFRAQLALAQELEKPAVVHDREAHAEVMAALREQRPGRGAVLHAFSGDQVMAEAAVQAGFYLGVDGPLTYRKSDGLRAIFAAVPLDRILIETDAPYLAPQPRRGVRNEPAFVAYVAGQLAAVRGMTMEAVASATAANAARLFGWELSQ